MTENPKGKVFRITFKSGSCIKTLDIEQIHIGLAIGNALHELINQRYTYKIEDCTNAELISEFVRISP